MLGSFGYVRPASLAEALAHLKSGARIHAGGTDLLGCLRDRVFAASILVSISGLKELAGIGETADGGVRIGALTTITTVAEHPLIRERYPGLAQGASEVASPQLRHQGTLGGNLCQKPRCWYYRGEFYCRRKGGRVCYAVNGENQYHCIFGGDGCFIVHPSDTAPPLAAFDALVEIAGPGSSRTVPLADFHVPPSRDIQRETILADNEIVTAILLPPAAAGMRSRYRKVRARRAWDFALAGVALALRFEGERVMDSRVVLSGAAPVPWRSPAVEEVIRGQVLTRQTIDAAAKKVIEGAKPLAMNGYKLSLFQAIIEEELLAIAGGTSA